MNVSAVGRLVLLVTIVVAAVVLAVALLTAFRQEPPPAARHYVGLSWPELRREGRTARLFSVTPQASGMAIASDRWTCSKTSVSDGDEFVCGLRQFRFERSAATDRLIVQGFRVPKGTVLSIGSGQEADVLVRGPGVGARHGRIWTLPSSAAPCDPKERNGLCIENGGAAATLAVYSDAGRRSHHLMHGEAATAQVGDEVWLGYVPFRVGADKDGLVLTVPLGTNAAGWTRLRGDREWQRLELPSWTIPRGDGAASRHDFYPEAVLDRMKPGGGEGNLSPVRVEFQQEEMVQTLIDHELLCLDRDAAGGGTVPRLRWRDPSRPGCSETSLDRDLRLAVPPEVERMYRVARTDRSINRLVTINEKRLEKDEFVDDPTEFPLIFDYRFKATPGGLRRTPVRLLGIRPDVSFHRARRSEVTATTEPDIRFAVQSDSPRLEVLAVGPSMAGGPLHPGLQLLLAPGPDAATRHAWIGVGGLRPPNMQNWAPRRYRRAPQPARGPAVLTLGSAWFGGADFAWLPSVLTAPANTLAVSFAVERRNRAAKTVVTPHGAPVLRNGQPIARDTLLRDGDTLTIGDLTLAFENGDGLAATSVRTGGGFHRTYPAGRDALQLIGFESRIGGVEASLTPQVARLARQQWAAQKTPIELTVRADLQHIVARELNTAVDAIIGDTAQMDDEDRRRASKITGSAVLMSSAGDVLAVGNAPTANMADAVEFERSLLDEERRHSEGRQAADQKLLNHAFLRALPVGSTQKIATSLALFRENRWPQTQSGASCTRHLRGYWIRSTRRTPTPTLLPLGKFDCNGNHAAALPVGALSSWQQAFRESCDVYFGLAALGLTPGYSWALDRLTAPQIRPGLSQTAGETRVVFGSEDPAQLLRPGSLLQPVSSDGDAYTETLLLLGYRFSSSFEGKGVDTQNAHRYDGIVYPTADRPWLPGLTPRAAFVYPTLAGPDGYTNVYARGGIQVVPPRTNVDIDGTPCSIKREHQWVEYLMTGWGQNVTGNALSIASSALPIVDDGALIPQPRILTSPQLAAATQAPPPAVLDAATLNTARTALRAGLHDVVTTGTARLFFAGSPVQAKVGGKTGTIQIETGDPEFTNASDPEGVRRIVRYACGVLDTGATPHDWDVVRSEYARLLEHDSGWAASLPPLGFAEGSAVCTAPFNPGMPRSVETVPGAPAVTDWEEFLSEELAQNDMRKVVSSAFVAVVLDPLVNPPAAPAAGTTPRQLRDLTGEGWVLGVIVDDRVPSSLSNNPTTAKLVSAEILESLQRYMEVRNQ